MIKERKQSNSTRQNRVTTATDTNFESLTKESGLCIVDFWAEWCGPCRMMSPIVEELAQEYSDRVLFCKLNVDENPSTAQRFGVMSIPTLIFLRKGKVVDTVIGTVPKRALEEKLTRHLS